MKIFPKLSDFSPFSFGKFPILPELPAFCSYSFESIRFVSKVVCYDYTPFFEMMYFIFRKKIEFFLLFQKIIDCIDFSVFSAFFVNLLLTFQLLFFSRNESFCF